MPTSAERRFRRVLVVTGDHALPDPTKWDGRYTDEDLALHERMRAALGSLVDYEFSFLTDHSRLVDTLEMNPPEFVLNFCDTGFGNVATRELHVPALLEMMDIPYSGAPPAGMVLCYDKSIVRMLAAALGVPTPREVYLEPADPIDPEAFPLPALIKPATGDGSIGITPEGVVETPEAAAAQVERLRRALPGQAALVQEFLTGAEYGLALVGNPGTGFTAFPPLQVDYTDLDPELPPILAFESKTGPATPYEAVRIRRADLSENDVAMLRGHAERLFARLQCRDYARFDFRAGSDGTIRLLEVNPNPAWSPEAKLALMAGFAGGSYPDLLRLILDTAQARL